MIIGQKVMDTVLRRTPLTDDEWRELLEERHQLVRPLLKEIAVAKLGDAHYSSPGISFKLSEFIAALPECSGKSLLQTRGIFGIARRRNKAEDDHRLYAYGLTRDDLWVYAELDVHDAERGVLVMVPLGLPEDFAKLDLSYRRLFNLLGRAVESWMRRRRKRLTAALELHRRFAAEDQMLKRLSAEGRAK